MEFWRGIDDRLLEDVKKFWQSTIGKEIINCERDGHKQFQVCVRNNYFNVYWKGCSVLKYQPNARIHKFIIHHKYAEAGSEKTYVDLISSDNDLIYEMTGWSFRDNILLPAKEGEIPVVIEHAGGEKGEKRSLAAYLAHEKTCWLDLEIAFSRKKRKDEVVIKRDTVADRVDLTEIVMNGGIPTLRFVEVKIIDDSRLRAKNGNPEIINQLLGYKEFIKNQKKNDSTNNKKEGLLKSYKRVAQNMLDLDLIHINSNLVKKFVEHGDIDDFPHLLIIGNKSDLTKGAQGKDHWEVLSTWAQQEDFPEPTFYLAKSTC